MKEKFVKYINSLFEINNKINALLKENKVTHETDDETFSSYRQELESLLAKKDKLIKQLKSLKKSSQEDFNNLKNKEYNKLWKKITELDKENLNLIESGQTAIRKDLVGSKMQAKAISSYKFNKENRPKLIDDQY